MCLKADPKLEQEKIADLCSNILKRDLRICKLFGGFMLPRFSKMLRFLSFAYAGYCSGQLFMPPPFCFVHIIASWLCANLRVVAPPYSRMCLKATRGGNNLFGKYGPNAWVSAWVLFCSEVGSTCRSEFWSDSWSEFGIQYWSSWGGFWSEFGLS